jgi:hypothetical protein
VWRRKRKERSSAMLTDENDEKRLPDVMTKVVGNSREAHLGCGLPGGG